MLSIFKLNKLRNYSLKKSIAILELYQHEEVVRHYCNLLQDSEYQIKIYCSSYLFEALRESDLLNGIETEVVSDNQSIEAFLHSNQQDLGNYDLVIITTILSHFQSFSRIAAHSNSALVIHNVHSMFAPQSHVTLESWKDIFRWGKIKGNASHKYKKEIVKKVNSYIFPSKELLDYAANMNPKIKEKPKVVLPFASYNTKIKIDPTNSLKITITIPGTVSDDVRDYKSIYSTLENLSNSLNKKINLVLLGKVNHLSIIDKFESIKTIQVTYFKEHLSAQAYDQYLGASDLLLLPIKKIGKNHIYLEKMGYSKISGTANDAVRAGIPTLIPESYPIPFGWSELFVTYKENNLKKKIIEILNDNNRIWDNIPEDAQIKFQRSNLLAYLKQIIP